MRSEIIEKGMEHVEACFRQTGQVVAGIIGEIRSDPVAAVGCPNQLSFIEAASYLRRAWKALDGLTLVIRDGQDGVVMVRVTEETREAIRLGYVVAGDKFIWKSPGAWHMLPFAGELRACFRANVIEDRDDVQHKAAVDGISEEEAARLIAKAVLNHMQKIGYLVSSPFM